MVYFVVLALVLGIKHAFDADHLVAVSNFLTRNKGMLDTARMGLSWAIGHMATAASISVSMFVLANQFQEIRSVFSQMEVWVGVMLIAIGAWGIFVRLPIEHSHLHTHPEGIVHSHRHVHRYGALGVLGRRIHLHPPLLGVGAVQGLASNDELLVLFVASLGVGSLELLLAGIGIFTLGVVMGMSTFGALLSYPLLKYGARRVGLAMGVSTGGLSILYGSLILFGLSGFNPVDLLLGD